MCIRDRVPALRDRVAGCLFLPIVVHGRRLGLLFLGLGASEEGEQSLIDKAALDFLANYLGFLGLFLAEKSRPAAGLPESVTHEGFGNIITCDERMLEMLALVRKVAGSDLTVLLRGETGTGKGMIAYALHRLSKRAEGRFQSINCAAIPETLLESELFGHVKGSFTGADANKRGLLLDAEGGTVFLDEIGKMSLGMQGKLLHFLDTRVVRPVGSSEERTVDVRIVCASKADLQGLVQGDRFLEDLYFRLLDFPLVVPPLRERPGDIPLLARHFVQKYGEELGGGVPELGNDLLDALAAHDWPGNIRELEKCLKRALVLAQGEDQLRAEHLPRELTPYLAASGRGGVPPLRETLAAVESREIAQALKASGGNKSAAARLLQISYPSLLKKIRLYGLA
jgi:transcriptional regulator with PAS, ATPase and Fis domain